MSDSSTTQFDLTARPWSPTGVTSADLLSRVQGEVAYWATQQASDGSIPDPYTNQTYAITASNFAYGAALLVSTGNTTYFNQAVAAMNWAANHYATTADDSTSDGLEFDITPLVNAYTLLKASGKVSASTLATWAQDLDTTKTNPLQLNSNWSTYAMNGAWLQYKAGLISLATATSTIESLWTQYQSARENSSTGGLYVDGSTPPYSLSVEAVGRGNIVALIAEGYNGPSAAAMAAASNEGSQASLLMEDPSGQVPAGGRTDDHLFVDAGYEAIDQTLAATTSNAELAAQYQTAADLTFNEMSRWENSNGTFQVTKNQFSPSLDVGYQTASTFSGYNTNLLASTATAYLEMTSKPVAEQPTQTQIGGYVYSTAAGFDATFANAGGTAIEIETQGATSQTFGQYWNTLGIDRIGRVDWDTRLGPSDGAYNGSDGVSFGPTWESGGSWIHLAAEAGKYTGSVTTSLATPVLTVLTVTWAPVSGGSGPTFTEKLTITPDGILSQTTESGSSDAFGMTLPLLENDGATTLTQTLANGIASVSYPGGTDAENFITLNSGAALTAESTILSTYGDITPVRATGSGSEADTFVYPSSSGDPAATAVKSSFSLTSTGYTSDLGWVNGTLYSGRTSAGGYGSSIALSGTGAPDATFSAPVDFILQVSNGVITNVETDAAVTATIEGKSYSLAAYTPEAVSGGSPPPPPAAPTMSLSAPGTVQEASVGAGVTVTETVSTTNLTGTIYAAVLTASGTGESYWQPETLGANGQASFKINLEHSGDYVVAVNNLSDPTIGAISAPVTITDPATSITLSAPGTVQEASVGAGVTVTETVSTTGLTGTIYAAVLTASGAGESYWQPETLGANGQASFKIGLEHSGDYVVAVNNLTDPTIGAISAPVTITDPVSSGPATVSVAKPTTLVAGQDTFTGTVTNGNPTSVEFAWHASPTGETATAADMVTATKQANGTYSATLTVDHVGQTGYFYVAVNGIVTDEWNAVPVAAASGSSASPSFIASAAAATPASTGAALQGAALNAQGTMATDLLAQVGGTGSSQSVVPPDQTSYSGASLAVLVNQVTPLAPVDHSSGSALS